MALNLDIQDIIKDVARTNLFEVEIPFLGQDFKFKCKAAAIPKQDVGILPVPYMNRAINLAGDRKYEPWTVEVYIDEKQLIMKQLYDWQTLAHSRGRELAGSSPENYKKSGILRHYARDAETITATYKFTGLIPQSIGEVKLAWGEATAAESVSVTFAIDWLESVPSV